MMDELEWLKKDWQKKEKHIPRLSYDDIYRMIWKKSSSIVKWIFYISIIEFVFWASINLISYDSESSSLEKSLGIFEITSSLTAINYVVLIFFIFKFYRNYRRISYTESSKKLMKAILDVKRTVTQYVWFNIAIFTVSFFLLLYGFLRNGEEGRQIIHAASEAGSPTFFWIIFTFICIAVVAIILSLIWLFYRVVYGILLRRLRNNYNELKQLEL